jgi:hypothetical protein
MLTLTLTGVLPNEAQVNNLFFLLLLLRHRLLCHVQSLNADPSIFQFHVSYPPEVRTLISPLFILLPPIISNVAHEYICQPPLLP